MTKLVQLIPRKARKVGRGGSPYTRRRWRRAAYVCGAATAVAFTPLLWVHLLLYRDNMAMASEPLPPVQALRPGDRLLILSPHPDDETLGAGGIMARAEAMHLPVRVVFLTNGDGSESTRLYENLVRFRRFPRGASTFIRLAAMRQQEALAATGRLGVPASSVTFLGYPDGGTRPIWESFWSPSHPYRSPYTGCDHSPYANSRTPGVAYCGQYELADVRGVIQEFRPTLVLTTHPADTHPDHHTAYDLCAAALDQLREDPSTPWAQNTRLMGFLVHHGPWPVPAGFHPDLELAPPAALSVTGTHWLSLPLTVSERVTKAAALEEYRSQLATTPRYLRSFVRRNELFGTPETASSSNETAAGKVDLTTVLVDPTHDALIRDWISSADISRLGLSTQANRVPNMVLQVVGEPSGQTSYEVVLHRVEPGLQVQTWKLNYEDTSRGWRAVAEDGQGHEENLAASASVHSLTCALPFQPQAGDAMLFRAATEWGATPVDETSTGSVRWTN